MSVYCSKCGEELMGSVNRCWRCGTPYVSRPGRADVPPVRRTPVRLPSETIEAEVLGEEAGELVASASHEATMVVPEAGHPFAGRAVRWGSPFALRSGTNSADDDPPTFVDTQQPRLPSYPRHASAAIGAILSIVLGLIGLSFAFVFPPAAAITAFVGMGLGIWGLKSKRRAASITGLLLCCLALMAGGFLAAVGVFKFLNPGAL